MVVDQNKQVIDIPICEVTLLEDRARIKRSGKVKVDAGVSKIVIENVSQLIADKTIQSRIKVAKDIGAVIAVKMHRQHIEIKNIRNTDVGNLNRKLNELNKTSYRLTEEHQQFGTDRSTLTLLQNRAINEMAIDASWGKSNQQLWQTDLDAIQEDIETLIKKRSANIKKQASNDKEKDELNAQLSSARFTTEEFVGSIEIAVNIKTKGNYNLEVEYIVPAACWRPCHTATLIESNGKHQLKIEAEACVWQSTGENWIDAKLYFSTQRPSLGVNPPELIEDLLNTQKKPEQIIVDTRDQTIQTTGLDQKKTSPEMPGIDDGGETLSLEAKTLSNIPSDGSPYRVVMYTMTSDTKTNLVCMPEISECAILQSEQVNTAKFPLLAGPVNLIRNNGKVGRTELSYVAIGETFKLGWGPDAEIRIKRWHQENEVTLKKLSSWEENKKMIKTRLSNIGADEKSIILSERIPVSEIEQVDIKYNKEESTGNSTPDKNGILTWTINLEAFGQSTCNMVFTVRKKKSVAGI